MLAVSGCPEDVRRPRFRDHYPPQRRGPIRLRDEFLPQAHQPCVQTPRLDLFECYPVDPRRARVGVGALVGV
jgi:hypothetical protein